MKRILSMLLCLALVIGFIPAVARAEGEKSASVTFSSFCSDKDKVAEYVVNGVATITTNLGTHTNTVPTYYANGTALRFYAGNNLIITPASGITITSMVLTTDSSYPLKSSAIKDIDNATCTENNTVIPQDGSKAFTVSPSSAVRVITLTLYYTEGTGGETPDPETCDHAEAKLTWEKNDTQHWQECECGNYTTTPVDHDFTNSNTCVCGQVKPAVPDTPAAGDSWTLVTDVSTLKAGDQIVIVAKDYNYALSTTQNTNNRGQAAITKQNDGETLETPSSSVQVLTLEAGETAGTFAFYTGSGYLYAASSSKNYLRTETTLSANSSWNITIAPTGVATIKATGTNTKNWLRYNSTSSLFSCYSSGQADVCIYKYEETTGCDGTNHTYVDGTCSCGEVAIKAESATLLYDDMIRVRIKFSIAQEADESGIMIFANSADAEARTNAILTGALVYSNNYYYGYSEGIAAKEMGKSAYYVGYAKYGDTYVYTSVTEYSPKIYAERMLAKEDSSAETKNLCVALMHYGAAAQTYFGSDGALMNTGVAPMDYDANVLGTEKFAVELGEKNGFTAETATMLFEGAITYRFKYSSNADLQGKALYLEYTIDSNTKSVPINDAGYAYITGNAPKDMDQVVVCKPYYLDEDGVTKVYGPSLTYSGYEYSRRIIDKSTNDAMIALAKAFAMYIHYVDIAIAANPA